MRQPERRRGVRRAARASIALAPMIARWAGDSDQLEQLDERYLLSPLLDGWRCLAVLDDRVRLRSRSGRDLAPELPRIAGTLGALRRRRTGRIGTTVLDGVLLRPLGEGDSKAARVGAATRFVLIDLLCDGGRDVTSLDLTRRRALLSGVELRHTEGLVSLAPAERGSARAYYEQFITAGHAGLLARLAGSRYRPGVRSSAWLAFSSEQTHEFALCGISSVGSLVLGMPTPQGLVFAGVTWPTRHWADLAFRCEPGPPPFPPPQVWGSLGDIAWSVPSLWVAVRSDLRDGSGLHGPRWRFLRVAEDLT